VISLEDDIPLPRAKRACVYPFGEMEIGQSFSVPLSGDVLPNSKTVEYNRVRAAASGYGKRSGKTFALRIDREANLLRCWRTT
jgi:hypothetical protein